MRESILAALAAALLWSVLGVLSMPAAETAVVPEEASGIRHQASGDAGQGSGNDIQGSGIKDQGAGGGEQAAEIGDQGAGGEAQAWENNSFDRTCVLPVLMEDGEVVSMELDRYLTGVLLAEMPLSFADEALKAQVTACRTYTLRSCAHPRHEDAAVCTDSRCCQGWRDPAAASPGDLVRAEAAVRATDGLAIWYGDELIDATFFSCSGGRTEDAAAVWGGALPYLKAVESPGEENAAHFTDEVRVPLGEFRAALVAQDGETLFPETLGAWVGSVTYTPGGGVDVMVIGGRPFRGTWLRRRFGLRSTVFTLELTAGEAVFSTRGYGHRVGMSQYGAQAMAEAGADFGEILTWYYQGVEIRSAE